MLIYKKSDLDALAIGQTSQRWKADGVISDESAKSLSAKFPVHLHIPNPFARIGLLIFGIICAGAAHGLLFFMLLPNSYNSAHGFEIITFVYGMALLALLEVFLKRDKPFYRSGLEEAALYYSMSCLAAGILLLTQGKHWPEYLLAGLGTIILMLAAFRYLDRLLAALGLACAFYAVFDICLKTGSAGRRILPFLVILLSALGAWSMEITLRKKTMRYWSHLLQTLRFLFFLTAYMGGNYFVVRELSEKLLGLSLGIGENLPFAPLFYIFTAGVPLMYIGLGLPRRDRYCLQAGLVTTAMAVFTYKYYHHLVPIEVGLTLAGLFLIALAAMTSRYFRTPKHGISVDSLSSMNRKGFLDAESLALLSTFGGKNSIQQNLGAGDTLGFQGGGGRFGGGGANGSF